MAFGDKCLFLKESNLLFHEKFGTWHAWRLVIIFKDIYLKEQEIENLQLDIN